MSNFKRIICLYGGPGSGKSTTCAGLFYALKRAGFNCEMNREYIKDWVWEGREILSGDQPYFFAKMARKEKLFMSADLDFIITDAPLILTHFYGVKFDPLEQRYNTSLMMLRNHHQICKDMGYKVDHFLIERKKKYNPSGRLQSEDEAKEIDTEIAEMLSSLNISFDRVAGDGTAVETIFKKLVSVPFHTLGVTK